MEGQSFPEGWRGTSPRATDDEQDIGPGAPRARAADVQSDVGPGEPRRLLVIKLADIGDLLTATPALRALRERYPLARIDVLAPPLSGEILLGLDSVDRLVLFEKSRFDSYRQAIQPGSLAAALRLGWALRRERYDCVILFHHLVTSWGTAKYAALALATGATRRVGLDNGLGRAWFLTERAPDQGFGGVHEVDYWLRVVGLLGATSNRPRLEVAITPEDLLTAESLLVGDERPTVAICAGTGPYSPARRWAAAGFAAVADALASRSGARIVLVGGSDMVEVGDEVARMMSARPVNLVGRTTLKQLAAVLHRCDLLVGNDGGVMHLATAVDTPVVAVFGPTNHRAWGPYGFAEWQGTVPRAGARHLVVRADPPCEPCQYVGHSAGRRGGCRDKDCMRRISPEAVIAAAESLLPSP